MVDSGTGRRISISFEIEMDEHLARNHATMHPLEVVRDVEGPMRICIESQVFFGEPVMLSLELAISLRKWTDAVRAGKIEDFVYESMEHDGPLLEFRRQPDGSWLVYSIWQRFESMARFSTGELLDAAGDFIERLRGEIGRLYGLVLE